MRITTDHRGQLAGATLATLWLVVVLGVDLATRRPTVVLAPLYAIAPLIACAVLTPAGTLGFAAAALLLAVASGAFNHVPATTQQTIRIVDVIVVGAVAVLVAVVRVRRERQHARMVRIAEVAQRVVLPHVPGRVGPVAVRARYLSAAEDALIGGDFYDCFHSERYTCFLIGDVRGKGIGAVEQAARVIRAFRQFAAAATEPTAVAREMSEYLAQFFDDEEFATAALLKLTGGSRMTLVSCGHPPPLLLSGRGAALLDPPSGLPLGLGTLYDSVTVEWAPGDRLLLYTDGLSEARDDSGRFLPLGQFVSSLRAATVDAALDSLLASVRRHVPAGRLTDDLALLLLENVGSQAEPPAADVDLLERVTSPLTSCPPA